MALVRLRPPGVQLGPSPFALGRFGLKLVAGLVLLRGPTIAGVLEVLSLGVQCPAPGVDLFRLLGELLLRLAVFVLPSRAVLLEGFTLGLQLGQPGFDLVGLPARVDLRSGPIRVPAATFLVERLSPGLQVGLRPFELFRPLLEGLLLLVEGLPLVIEGPSLLVERTLFVAKRPLFAECLFLLAQCLLLLAEGPLLFVKRLLLLFERVLLVGESAGQGVQLLQATIERFGSSLEIALWLEILPASVGRRLLLQLGDPLSGRPKLSEQAPGPCATEAVG